MFRIATRLFVTSAVCLALGGCGGGPDLEYDCQQTLACEKSKGTDTTGASVETCVEFSEALIDGAGDDAKQLATDLVEGCKPKTGCEYTDCISSEGGML